jgi:isocitrate dehydrogenase (NAD+)
MAKHRITLIAGDGIGPEITRAVVKILETAGLDVEWEPHLAGIAALDAHGTTLPTELLDSIVRNRVALKGPLTDTGRWRLHRASMSGCERRWSCLPNLRPVWNIPAVPSRYQGVDLVIVRENTEDLYSGTRTRGCTRCRREPEDHHHRCVYAHRAVRVRLCAAPRP